MAEEQTVAAEILLRQNSAELNVSWQVSEVSFGINTNRVQKSKLNNVAMSIDQDKPLPDTELEQFILMHLKRQDSINQITTLISEMLGCDWYAGERLVKQVQNKHKIELNRQTHRRSIPIGIMSIVSGIVIVFFVSLWLKPFVYLFNIIQAGETINVGTARALLYLLTSPQTPRTFYLAATLTLTGLGMILGGVVGIVQAVYQLWRLHD